MSTDLYRIRVLALDPALRKVTFRVLVTYYDYDFEDSIHVPSNKGFFLRMLGDAAHALSNNVHKKVSPKIRSAPIYMYEQELFDDEFADGNADDYVDRVTRLSSRNDPLSSEKPPMFVRSEFDNEDILMQADYEVIVRDATWIEHLAIGDMWQTAG